MNGPTPQPFIMNEASFYTTGSTTPILEEKKPSKVSSVCFVYDPENESDVKPGYTKGNEEILNVFRIGKFYVCWGREDA